MTAKDSADGVLGDIAAAGATEVWNVTNIVLNGCGLTHAGADLQGFGNLRDRSGPCMPYFQAQFQTNVLRTPESRPRIAAACPKKTRIKSTKKAVTPILGRINALRLPNGQY